VNRRNFIIKILFSAAALSAVRLDRLLGAFKLPGFVRAGKIKEYPGRIKRLSLTQIRKMGLWSG